MCGFDGLSNFVDSAQMQNWIITDHFGQDVVHRPAGVTFTLPGVMERLWSSDVQRIMHVLRHIGREAWQGSCLMLEVGAINRGCRT